MYTAIKYVKYVDANLDAPDNAISGNEYMVTLLYVTISRDFNFAHIRHREIRENLFPSNIKYSTL